MKYKHILALDPSGNYLEGKGSTGWVVMNYKGKLIARGYISARNFHCPEEYWNAHLDLINLNREKFGDTLILVIEDYILYRNRSLDQTNSKMETCRLLGLIQWHCWKIGLPYSLQLAALVKNRWSDDVLLNERILFKDRNKLIHTESGLSLNLIHTRDAFRHAIHYIKLRNEYKKKPTYTNFTKGVRNHVQSNY